MDTRTLLLVIFIGAVSCDESLPPCSFADLSPCINDATKSYILATKVEQAASLPPDPVSSMLVGEALSYDATSPDGDLNKTCSTTANMDMDTLGKCLLETEKVCFSGVPSDMTDVITQTLPVMRTPTMGESSALSIKLCTPGCMKDNLVYERMTALRACWKDNEAAVEAMLAGAEPQCTPADAYMQCSWQHAVGCDFTEALVRLHLQTLEEVITKCEISLPAAATQEQKAMVSRGCSLAAPGIVQVMLHVVVMIATLSFVKTEMGHVPLSLSF